MIGGVTQVFEQSQRLNFIHEHFPRIQVPNFEEKICNCVITRTVISCIFLGKPLKKFILPRSEEWKRERFAWRMDKHLPPCLPLCMVREYA